MNNRKSGVVANKNNFFAQIFLFIYIIMSNFKNDPRSLQKLQTLQECVCLLDTMKTSLSMNNMDLRTKIKSFEQKIDSVLKEDMSADTIDIFQTKCDLIECLKFEDNPELSVTKLEACPNVRGTPQCVDIDLNGTDLSERGIIEQKLLTVCQVEKKNLKAKNDCDDIIEYRCEATVGNSSVYYGLGSGNDASGQSIVCLSDDSRISVANSGKVQVGFIETEKDGLQPVERGIMHIPLWECKDTNGKYIYGSVSDISDPILAERFGAILAPTLLTTPCDAMEDLGHMCDEESLISNEGLRVTSFCDLEKPGLTARTLKGIRDSLNNAFDPPPLCAAANYKTIRDALQQDPVWGKLSDGQRDAVNQMNEANDDNDVKVAEAAGLPKCGDVQSTALGPSPNNMYSDHKKFTITRGGKKVVVVINLPIIAWGDEVCAYPGYDDTPDAQVNNGDNRLDNGKQYVVDFGGQDSTIRKSPPNSTPETKFVNNGPPPCPDDGITPLGGSGGRLENRDNEGALERYKGGQCLGINTSLEEKTYFATWFRNNEKGIKRAEAISEKAGCAEHKIAGRTAIWKIHKGNFLNNQKVSYYTAFAASRPSPAGFLGSPYTPKQNHFGRGKDVIAIGDITELDHWLNKDILLAELISRGSMEGTDYIITNDGITIPNGKTIPRISAASATLVQFANGLPRQDGGPNRFQPALMPFAADSASYTPMWHVNFGFLNAIGPTCETGDMNEGELQKPIVENAIPPVVPSGGNPNIDGLLLKSRNVSACNRGNLPGPVDDTSNNEMSAKGFNMAHLSNYDPMQTVCNSKNLCCEEFARKLSEKHGAGPTGELDSATLGMIQANNEVMLTEAPPGAKQGWKEFLIINCPIPVGLDIKISNCGAYRYGYKDTANHCRYYNSPIQDINNGAYRVCPSDKTLKPSKNDALPTGYTLDTDSEQETSSRTAYVIITDSSDEELATKYNAIFAPSLNEAPNAACELNVGFTEIDIDDKNAGLALCEDPGTVNYINTCDIKDSSDNIIIAADAFIAPKPNLNYSPLKRFTKADGTCVTINCSTISWKKDLGADANKAEQEENTARQYIVDKGGCDPRIRGIPPSPFVNTTNPAWPQAGPPGCTDKEAAMDRYKGGQALDINLENQTALWKLHEATFTPDVIPYYTVFEASSPPAAQFMGVVQAPKLNRLGRGTAGTITMGAADGDIHGNSPAQTEGDEVESNAAVATLWQFNNGISQPAGGPNRFQPGIVPFDGTAAAYTPQWHINMIHYNMTECTPVGSVAVGGQSADNTVMFDKTANVQFGATPSATNPNPKFRGPGSMPVFDPFQLKCQCIGDCKGCIKGANNPDWVNAETAMSSFGPGKLDQATMTNLITEGKVLLTEAPPGAREFGDKFLVVNCPLPFQIKKSTTQVFPCGDGGGPPPPSGPQNITITGNDITTNWFRDGQTIPNGSTITLRPDDIFQVELDTNSSATHGWSMSFPPGEVVSDIWDELSGLYITELVSENLIFTTILSTGLLAGQVHMSTSNIGFSPNGAGGNLIFKGKVKPSARRGPISVACSVHGPVAMIFILNIQ